MRPLLMLLVLLATLAGAVTRSAAAPAPRRPNIIVILSDDMGYSDLGCYGGEIRTPNLDRLAANGLRFTQFYNTARCCPTRAALLTGLYSHQAGVGHMTQDRGADGYRGDLNRSCVTMAEVLKPAGYATYAVGKWHVTKYTKPEGPKDNWPLQRGFDHYYGTIAGGGSYWDPVALTRDNTMISPFADPEYRPTGRYYYTDAIADNAVRYVTDHHRENADQPFFMYVAFTAAHWPMNAPEEEIAKYRGKYDAGYEPVRRARYERLKKLGLVDPRWPMTPTAGEWDRVSNQAWEARCMEVYAAMVDRMDQGIGRLVEALRKSGQLDNTLLLFLQDNGGCAEDMGRRPTSEYTTRPEKPPFPAMRPDELQTTMIPKQTRDGYPVIQGPAAMPGPDGTFIAYGQGWANVSNTPFREYKHWVHEGGISTPLIAHWPARIRRRGELERQPGHLIDVMATCVDVSGAPYPRQYQGHAITPLEGRSLVPAFEGKKVQREAIFWEHEGNRAVRVGDWKLVAKGEKGPWELYDLAAGRTELHDLAAQQPDRVKQLAAMWQAWAERAHVLPLNPGAGETGRVTFSKKTRFELQAGDTLSRAQAPYLPGKALLITADVEDPRGSGVLVAQGGSAEGYSLYLRDGRPVFALRRERQLTEIAGREPLPAGPVRLSVALKADGGIVLQVNGKAMATGKAAGPLTAMPVDGLQVGRDTAGAVGSYDGPFPFAGKIHRVSVEVGS